MADQSIKFDTSAARKDLEAFARAIDSTVKSAKEMDKALASATSNISKSMTKAADAMERYGKVVEMVSKMKFAGGTTTQLKALAGALNDLGSVKVMNDTKLTALSRFFELIPTFKVPNGGAQMGQFLNNLSALEKVKTSSANQVENLSSFFRVIGQFKGAPAGGSGLAGFAKNLASLDQIKVPTATQVNNLKGFFKALETFKGPPSGGAGPAAIRHDLSSLEKVKIPTATQVNNLRNFFKALTLYQAVPASKNLASLLSSLTGLRVPTSAQITRLREMFTTLASAKAIPNATTIARDLDTIAAAAVRASNAMAKVNFRGVTSAIRSANSAGGGGGGAARGGGGAGRGGGRNTTAAVPAALLSGLGLLNERLHIGYQLGTAFSTVFSAFTFGEFIRSVYDAEVTTQKFNKAMIFVTGTFEGAHQAAADFMAMSNDLGLNFEKNADSMSRFTVSAKAVGANLDDVKKILGSATLALQVAGASAQQTEYAFYGLGQMLSKGKIMSEEFNRQVGEQIPGNVVAGVRALSTLEGHITNAADLFNQMKKGNLTSLPFLRAWADELKRMYEPLKELIQARPDTAIHRLQNAWFSFRKTVAESGFTGAFVNEMNAFSSKMQDQEGHLTAAGQHLAEAIGKGLGQAVHLLADGINWAVAHLDLLVKGLKAFAIITIAGQVATWAKSLDTLGNSFLKAAADMKIFYTEQKALAAGAMASATPPSRRILGTLAPVAAGAYGAASGVASGGLMAYATPSITAAEAATVGRAEAAVVGSGLAVAAGGRYVYTQPSSAFGGFTGNGLQSRAPQGNNFGLGAATVASIGAGSAEGAKAAFTAGSVAVRSEMTLMTRVAQGAAIGFAGLKTAFSLLPGILLGVVVALAIFSDSVLKLGKKSATVGDVIGGAFKVLGDDLGKFAQEAGNLLSAIFGGGKEAHSAGDLLVGTLALIVAGFGLFTAVVESAVTPLAHIIGSLIYLGTAAYLLSKGRTKDAGSMAAAAGREITSIPSDFEARYKDVNPFSIYDQIKGNAIKTADARNGAAGADAATTELADRITKILAIHDLEDKALQNQGIMESLRRRAEAGANAGQLSNADFMKRINAASSASGNGRPLAFDDLQKGAKTAANTTIDAAKQAAEIQIDAARKAALQTSGAGSIAPGLLLTGATARMGAKPEVVDAIQQAATVTGISEDVLAAIAKRESGGKFDTHAVNPNSSARGLFQFLFKEAKAYGLTAAKTEAEYKADPGRAFEALPSAIAAAQMLKDNNEQFRTWQVKNGGPDAKARDMTGGEAYGSFFLGVGGLEKLIMAEAQHPETPAATLFPDAAKANPFMRNMTAKELYLNLTSTVNGTKSGQLASGASSMVAAPGLAGATPADAEAITKQYDTAMETYNSLIKPDNAAATAEANLNNFKTKMAELTTTQNDLRGKFPTMKDFIDPKKVEATLNELQHKFDDALNPFAKQNQLDKEANAVLELRGKGLSDEADWQVKINQMKEQNVDLSKIDLDTQYKLWQIEQDRADVLKTQIDLTKARNEIEIQNIGRTGSGEDVAFAQLLQPFVKEGQTRAQALDALAPDAVANLHIQAREQNTQRIAAARDTMGDQTEEMSATQHLNASSRSYRSDYLNALKEFTGNQRDNLELQLQLVAKAGEAGQDWKDSAKALADAKYAFEHEPGFQKWADALQPVADRLNDIKSTFAEDLSSSLAGALVGDKVDWRGMIHNLARSVVKIYTDEALKKLITGGSDQNGPGGAANDNSANSEPNWLQRLFGVRATPAHAASGAHGAAAAVKPADYTITATNVTVNAQNLVGGMGSGAGVAGGAGGGAGAAPGSIEDIVNSAEASNYNPFSTGSSTPATSSGGSTLEDFINSAASSSFNPFSSGSGIASTAAGGGGIEDIINAAASSNYSPFSNNGPSSAGGINDIVNSAEASNYSPFSPNKAYTVGDETTVPEVTVMGKPGGNQGFGGFVSNLMSPVTGLMNGIGLGGVASGVGGMLGGLAKGIGGLLSPQLALGVLGSIIGAFTKPAETQLSPPPPVNGVLGGSNVTTNGTEIAGHSNPIGDILTMFAQAAIGKSFGSGGKLNAFFGGHSEGGYADSPVTRIAMNPANFNGAPHYNEGTANTSGIPVVVHPDEAIIPLSRGRKIPVDMNGSGSQHITINQPINIMTPNADSFRASQASITRKQDLTLRRAAARNLTGGGGRTTGG